MPCMTDRMNDAFGRQVQSYYAGTQYTPARADALAGGNVASGRITDETLRSFAEAAYTRPPRLRGFTLVPGLSTAEALVYVDPVSRQAVVTHRGSVNWGDAWTDARLATGGLTNTARYRRSQAIVARAVDALPGYSITQTGHSLGASLSRANASARGVGRSVGFNTGYEVGGRASNRRNDRNYSEYLNSTDLVSFGAYGRRRDPGRNWYSNGRYAFGAHRARPTKWQT